MPRRCPTRALKIPARAALSDPAAAGLRGSDALIDRQRLFEVCGALAEIAVPEVAVADAFQGTCFVFV
jgi:hypothetical protein